MFATQMLRMNKEHEVTGIIANYTYSLKTYPSKGVCEPDIAHAPEYNQGKEITNRTVEYEAFFQFLNLELLSIGEPDIRETISS